MPNSEVAYVTQLMFEINRCLFKIIVIIIYLIFQNDRVAPKVIACTRVLPLTHTLQK